MDIHVFPEEHGVIEFLTRSEILSAFFHKQRMEALVRTGKPHPHSLQAVGSE